MKELNCDIILVTLAKRALHSLFLFYLRKRKIHHIRFA